MIRKVLALPLTFLLAGSLLAENQTFTKIKYMKPVEDKSKEIDSRLILSGDQVEVQNKKTGEPLKAIKYAEIKSATCSKSKHPRWKSGAGAAVALGVFAIPIFFMKGKKHWLALQGEDNFMVLKLDKKNYQMVIPALESRAGLEVERLEED